MHIKMCFQQFPFCVQSFASLVRYSFSLFEVRLCNHAYINYQVYQSQRIIELETVYGMEHTQHRTFLRLRIHLTKATR